MDVLNKGEKKIMKEKVAKSFTLDNAVLLALMTLKKEKHINLSSWVNRIIKEKLKEEIKKSV